MRASMFTLAMWARYGRRRWTGLLTMNAHQALVDLLIAHEGIRLTVYQDLGGVPTIGVGRNLRGRGISQAEAMVLLENDIAECLSDLHTFAWFPDLDPGRQRAVTDLRFNVGATSFRTFRDFIAAMARKDYPRASLELQNSRWRYQVGEGRVNDLRTLIEQGDTE